MSVLIEIIDILILYMVNYKIMFQNTTR